jgi:hypothetical protein
LGQGADREDEEAMKGKIFIILFALPFFGVGVWMLFAISSDVFDTWQMQDWQSVEARLSNAGYETHSGEDSDTYEAFAVYSYRYQGGEYTNDRIGLTDGADNIGDYQADIGRRLSDTWSRGEPINIYVNPVAPQDSVIDRNLRWGMIGFRAIFVFTFGGIGLGLIILALRTPKPKDATAPKFTKQPWLLNDDWQTSVIRSNSKSSMYFTWGFAAFWNLISAPLPFVMYREIIQKENYVAIIAALFPLIGVGLIVWAIRRTLEWKRFGAAPVTLDPFPGGIGGNVGGAIDIRMPFASGIAFRLTLTSIYSYMSGSGDSRSRKESAKWQDSVIGHAQSGLLGTRLTFRFDVPTDLRESDAERADSSYYLWRLNVQADLEGVDFDRDYEIPVYATGEESLHLSAHNMQSARGQSERLDDIAVEEKIRRRMGAAGAELFYPPGRNRLSALVGTTIGGLFAAAGWFLVFSEGLTFFGGVFATIGSLIVLASLYSVLNSLQIVSESASLSTVRRVLGIAVRRRQIRRQEFVRFGHRSSSQTQAGKRHVIHYSIFAEDAQGQKVTVGEGFDGEGEARAAIRLVANVLGLQSDDDSVEEARAEQFDVLAANR